MGDPGGREKITEDPGIELLHLVIEVDPLLFGIFQQDLPGQGPEPLGLPGRKCRMKCHEIPINIHENSSTPNIS